MKNYSALPYYSLLLIFCISLLSINKLSAQENNIYEVQQNEVAKSTSKNDNNRKRFYDLTFNLHTTLYIENNKVKVTYGSGEPIKLTFADSKSFNWLKNNSKTNTIELITITLNNRNDLNNLLDLSNNNDFKSLKYVYVKCNFDCSEKDIEKFIKVNHNVRVFYSNQTPS